eukprot:scaffold55582_cov47-Prasinocladus_malaysianus.AAC.5
MRQTRSSQPSCSRGRPPARPVACCAAPPLPPPSPLLPSWPPHPSLLSPCAARPPCPAWPAWQPPPFPPVASSEPQRSAWQPLQRLQPLPSLKPPWSGLWGLVDVSRRQRRPSACPGGPAVWAACPWWAALNHLEASEACRPPEALSASAGPSEAAWTALTPPLAGSCAIPGAFQNVMVKT